MSGNNVSDPYEREQNRLRQLYEEMSSSEEDPYHDIDGEYGSDKNYVPSETSNSKSSNTSLSGSSSIDLENEAIPSSNSDDALGGSDWEDSTTSIPDFFFDENTSGLKINISPDAKPLEVFEYLFAPHIMEYIIECSNLYGQNLCQTNRPKTRHSLSASFRPITINELKSFFGLCLLQGQISTTNTRRYFSYKDVLYFHPIFPYVMSARRYEQILRVLCCSSVNSKKKEKVQPLIDMLLSQYQNSYGPKKELSIDESLLHFRGRLAFRVYIKNKKDRYGIKFFELTTSDGYLLNMEMYSGKTQDITMGDTKTEALVLKLMEPYLMKGHELYMDNYYNSVQLSEKLLTFKTHTTGTLRSNRKGNPTSLVKRKLKRGEHYWLRRKRVYVSKWKDKRDVLVLTTKHHPCMVQITNRHGKEKLKPLEVVAYNDHMSGIDRCDQMIATYATPRKTIRWYKKVILYLLDVSTWNAFFLYRKYVKGDSRSYRFVQFRDELIKSLISLPSNLEAKDLVLPNIHDNRRVNHTQTVKISEQPTGHWPEKIPGVPGAKSNKKSVFQKCRLCSKKQLRRETSFRCKGCETKPPLCPTCFEEWHLLNSDVTEN